MASMPPAEGRPRPSAGAPQPALVQPASLAPGAASPGGVGGKQQQPLLKRRPQLSSAAVGEGVDDGSSGGGNGPLGSNVGAHATPFAELIARRGGDANGALGSLTAHGHGGEAGGAPNGDGLVAGLELLVSHVRRTNGGASAGTDGTLDGGGGGYEGGGDLLQRGGTFGNGRSKSSPVAGRRALPPSAIVASQQQLHHQHQLGGGLESGNGDHRAGLGGDGRDDAIHSLSAGPRGASRRAGGFPDDDMAMGLSHDGGTGREHDAGGVGGGAPGASSFAATATRGGGLSMTLPPGSGMPGAHAPAGSQALSMAARQRWSARENDRAPPSHAPLPFGKDASFAGGGGAIGNGSASLNNTGSWPPRTWHSYAHGGGGVGAPGGGPSCGGQGGCWVGSGGVAAAGLSGSAGSRPRSVEGGARPLDPRAGLQQQQRRSAYYS